MADHRLSGMTVDATWLIAMRYRAQGGSRCLRVSSEPGSRSVWVWVVFGRSPGYLLGAFIADPKRFGFDLDVADLLRRHVCAAVARRAARRRLGGRGRRRADRVLPDPRLVVHRGSARSPAASSGPSSMMNDPLVHGALLGILAMAAATCATRCPRAIG